MKSNLFFAMLAVAAAPCGAAVIHVPDAGAGIVTPADALAVAQTGDTILIAPGTYVTALTISTVDLIIEASGAVELRGIPGSCSSPQTPLVVDGVEGVILRNLTITGAANSTCGGPSASITAGSPALRLQNAGVTVEGCTLSAGLLSAAVNATGSTINFSGCTLTGSVGRSFQTPIIGPASGPTVGLPALYLDSSILFAEDSTFSGGKGGSGGLNILLPIAGANGGSAIEASNSSVVNLTGSILTGGDGGDSGGGPWGGGGGGGCGLYGDASSALALRVSTTITGGSPGTGTSSGPSGDALCIAGIMTDASSWLSYE